MTEISPLVVQQVYAAAVPESRYSKRQNVSIFNGQDKESATVTQNYEYKPNGKDAIKGTLYQFPDGHCSFETTAKINNQQVPVVLEFKSMKDVERHRPLAYISNPYDDTNRQTTLYKYNHFGKIKEMTVLNAQDKIISETKYNKNGKISEKNLYDPKTGELKNVLKYEYKDNTQIIRNYDSNNRLITTTTVEYTDNDQKTKKSAKVEDSNGQLVRETQYYANGKPSSMKRYEEGKLVEKNTFYESTGVIKDQYVLKDGKWIHKISSEIDLNFDIYSSQKQEGDCYLMATIHSIIGAEGGKDYLKSLFEIKQGNDGKNVYKITLPGAKIAAQGLKTDERINPDKMYITGEYEFTQEEVDKILSQAGKKYSIGNANVILLEAAFERFREEAKKTMKANGININESGMGQFGFAGLMTGANSDNILNGGAGFDATFILTGQQSQIYTNKNSVAISYVDMQGDRLVPVAYPNGRVKAAVSEIDGNVQTSQEELDKMLEKIREDYKDGRIDNITTVGFATDHGPNKPKGGHLLTVIGIEGDEILFSNPWHPEKSPIRQKISDFKLTAKNVYISTNPVSQLGSAEQVLHQAHLSGTSQVSQNSSQQTDNVGQNGQNQSSTGAPVTGLTNPQQTQQGSAATYERVKIKPGTGYTTFIRDQLIKQGVSRPTAQQIIKAKEQFEAANPKQNGSMAYVHTYTGANSNWKGNKYLIMDTVYNVPKFDV